MALAVLAGLGGPIGRPSVDSGSRRGSSAAGRAAGDVGEASRDGADSACPSVAETP